MYIDKLCLCVRVTNHNLKYTQYEYEFAAFVREKYKNQKKTVKGTKNVFLTKSNSTYFQKIIYTEHNFYFEDFLISVCH